MPDKKLTRASDRVHMSVMGSLFKARNKLGQLLGRSFNDKRQLYEVFGYTEKININAAMQRYRRQDIAARVIDAPADALWTSPPIITSNNDEWDKAWRKLVNKHSLWSNINKVDKLAGIGQYAVLLIGMTKSGKLNTRPNKIAGRDVLFLQPYGQNETDVHEINADITSPNYLEPELYKIDPKKTDEFESIPALKELKVGTMEVHSARVLHVAENQLTNMVYGNPRLERVWNALDDLLKIVGGTSETYWLTANRGMQIDVNPEMTLSEQDEEDLTEEIEEYMHNLRRFIRTRGVKIENLGSDVPNPAQAFSMILSVISGATGIPKRILIGSEAGQLASDQDRNNWAERIEERRANFGEPVVIRPLIAKFTDVGILPDIDDLEINIKWPSAFKQSPYERAQTSAQHARSATNFARARKDSRELNEELVTIDEARDMMGLMDDKNDISKDELDTKQ